MSLDQATKDAIRALQAAVHQSAVDKGWHEWRRTGGSPDIAAMLINITGEVSEAWEEYRSGRGGSETWYSVGVGGAEGSIPKPEGIPSELADILIRVCDTAAALGVDLADALEEKMAYNALRSYRHGGKLA